MSIPPRKALKHVFDSPESCIDYLFEEKILYQGFKCPKHKKNMFKNKNIWKCIKRDCIKEISIFFQSFFTNSKINVNEILEIIYYKLSGAPSTSIGIITGHSSTTISAYLKRYRELLASNINECNKLIGGPNIEVEIDETLISREKNLWTNKDGVWVFGGVERTSERNVFAVIVPDRTQKTLLKIIKENIHPDSIIISDFWVSYKMIEGCNRILINIIYN
jgi:ISXO2-like transposase domain